MGRLGRKAEKESMRTRSCYRISKHIWENVKALLAKGYSLDRIYVLTGVSLISIKRIKNTTSYREFSSDRRWRTFRARNKAETPITHEGFFEWMRRVLFA